MYNSTYIEKIYKANNDKDKLLDIPKEYWDVFDELIVKAYRGTIEVVYENQFRTLVDKHFGNNQLCYLSDSDGIPVEKSKIKVTERGLLRFQRLFNCRKEYLANNS